MNKKIQVLRAFAISAVVMIHSNVDGLKAVIDRPFLNFAVALFVFCSGYLTKISVNDIKVFYKKRILRVLIPYIIWSIIYTIAYGDYREFFGNILTGKSCFTFYFIFVYIQLVIITPIIGKLLKSKYIWIGWSITPIYILITRYLCNFMGINLGFPFPETFCFAWFIYYYLGMALGNNIITYNIGKKSSIKLYLFALIASEMEGLLWYMYGDFDMATTQLRLTSIITSVMVLFLSYLFIINNKEIKTNLLNRILVLIGDYSFGIYLSHILVRSVLSKIPGYSYLIFPINSLTILIVTIICIFIGKKILGSRLSKYMGF